MTIQPTTPPRHVGPRLTCREAADMIRYIVTGQPRPGTGKRADA